MAAEAAFPSPREEPRCFTQRTLRRELEGLSNRLQRSMREEMERFMSGPLAEGEATKQAILGPLVFSRPSKSSRASAESLPSPANSSVLEGPHSMLHVASPPEEPPALEVGLPGLRLNASQDPMLPGSPSSASDMDTLRMASATMDDSSQPPGGRSTSSSPSQQQVPAKLPEEALEPESMKDELAKRSSTVSEDTAIPGCTSIDSSFFVERSGNRQHGRRKSRSLVRSRSRSNGELEQLPTFIGFRRGSTDRRPSLSWSSTMNELSPQTRRRGSASVLLGRSFNQSTTDVYGMPTLTSGSKSDAAMGQDSLRVDPDGPTVMSSAGYRSSSSRPETGFALAFSRLLHLVEGSRFDSVSGVLVSLNAISIGWQTDYMASHSTDQLPSVFRVSDVLFCLVFIVELALRILAHGKGFFCGHEWRWNVFDFTMVALQIFEEITTLIAAGSDEHSTSVPGGSNFSYLRMLRLVRLVRVLRMVRVLRFIGELRKLVCSIGNSLQSLAWTLVLLIFMLYAVGICFTQIVSHHVRSLDGLTWGEEVLHSQFGSLGSSVLSLFQAISGGMDWDNLSRPLREVHWTLELLFALYIAFSVLAMLNVVTGVFVEGAVQSSTKDQEDDFVLRMRDFYDRTNLSGDGRLTWGAFELQLQKQDVAEYFQNVGINITEAKSLFELLDVNDSGEIDADEFVMGCLRLRGPAKSVDLVTLMYDNKRMLGKLHDIVSRLAQALQHPPLSLLGPLLPPPTTTASQSLPLTDT